MDKPKKKNFLQRLVVSQMFNSKQLDTQTAYLQGNTNLNKNCELKKENRLKLNLIHSIIKNSIC